MEGAADNELDISATMSNENEIEELLDQHHAESSEDSEPDEIRCFLDEHNIKNNVIYGKDKECLMPEESSDHANETTSSTNNAISGIPSILLTSTSLSSRILENNISRLRKIQDEVNRCREQKLPHIAKKTWMLSHQLSQSCPSLLDEEAVNEYVKVDIPSEANDWQQCLISDTGEEGWKLTEDASAIMRVMDSGVIVPTQNEKLLGTPSDLNALSTRFQNGVKIHINDLTPNGSQECLATKSNILVSKEMQQGSNLCSNRQLQQHQEGLDLENSAASTTSCIRRRSWSSADQDEEKFKIKKILAKTQRSMSLSSLDSETEETFFDARDSTVDELDMTVSAANNDSRREKQRSFSGSSSPLTMPLAGADCTSYHSLNDYTIQYNAEQAVIFSEGGSFKFSSRHNLVAPRTTLQKSVSTPSIVAVKEGHDVSGKKTLHHSFVSSPKENAQDSALSKRKKRGGSIFSRKKRGKDKEPKKTTHRFVTACYSNSAVCDVCNKSMANKPALHCESCLVIVHEHSCKDQISDCSQFKAYQKGGKILSNNLYQTGAKRLPVGKTVAGIISISPPIHVKEKKNSSSQMKHMQQSSNSSSLKLPIPTPSKVINEEKETDASGEEVNTNIIELNSTSLESLEEDVIGVGGVNVEIDFVEDDPDLKLLDDEPETWSLIVDKKILKKLKDKEIKKQEGIYELILTEKHHCLTLKIMQNVYAQGMLKEVQMMPAIVNSIFPKLDDLLDFHLLFLKRLRERQKKDPVIENIGDLILEQFHNDQAERLRVAYGEFCSQHTDAVAVYKDFMKQDRKFQNFIKKISQNPLCKSRQIPECILLVTQRMTKYPLVLQSLMKNTKENKTEYQTLSAANTLVKEIINKINTEVAEKEKKQRLLEIYHKIDAKSATIYRGKKFKKSDVLSNNRKLRYEGPVKLNQARGKVLEVTAVLLSDVIFFLQDNNQKYSFVTQDNKAGVISLQKLLIREKAGQDSKGIYLISSNPKDPEMYELVCLSQKEKKIWTDAIRAAVEVCPEEDEGTPSEEEEERKINEFKSAKLTELLEQLHEKDIRLAFLCEEKMKLLTELMENIRKEESLENGNFKYSDYMTNSQEEQEREDIFSALKQAYQLANSLYSGGTNLGRSVSSAGEHQSEAYILPILPKRAETFGGFDNPIKDANNIPKGNGLIKKLHLLKDAECRAASLVNLTAEVEKESESSDGITLYVNRAAKEGRRASGPLPCIEKIQENCDKSSARRSTMASGFLTPEIAWSDEKSGLSCGISEPSLTNEKGMIGELLAFSSTPSLITLGKDHCATALQLSHYLNTLMCLLSKHFTNVASLKAQLTCDHISKLRQEGKVDKRHLYRPNQQLEELRNLQKQLSQERETWQHKYDTEKLSLENEKQELQKFQDQLKQEKIDIQQQRDHLYSRLENLQRQGFSVNRNMTIVGSGNIITDEGMPSVIGPSHQHENSASEIHRRSTFSDPHNQNKDTSHVTGNRISNSSSTVISPLLQSLESNKKPIKSEGSIKGRPTATTAGNKRDGAHMLPINLYSATNQQKTASQTPPVRQQLPLKLANHDPSNNSHQHYPYLLKQADPIPGTRSASLPSLQPGVYLRNNSSTYSPSTVLPTADLPSQSGTQKSSGVLQGKNCDSNQQIIYF